MWPFLTVHRVGSQCVIVVFPDHTYLFVWGFFLVFLNDIENHMLYNLKNYAMYIQS